MRAIDRLAAVSILSLVMCAVSHAVAIGDLCEVQGVRGNELQGIGLVVGLAGTGDSAEGAIRAQERALRRLGIEVASTGELNTDNTAVVIVQATLPSFAKAGTRIDVRVSSLYDCESLEGGILLETLLEGMDGRTYAVASGPVSTGGFNADAQNASARRNHVTVGRIPNGASVEREVPSTVTDGERIMLTLNDPNFITANNIRDRINDTLGTDAAFPLGAGSVSVRIPNATTTDLVGFIAKLQQLEVVAAQPARIVVNERTGTIVVGGDVQIKPCQVAHGNITIEVATTPLVSQPNPLAQGETVETEVTRLDVGEEGAYLMPVEGTTASDVAQALNDLKVTPRDMISIFQALKRAGALDAQLEIM